MPDVQVAASGNWPIWGIWYLHPLREPSSGHGAHRVLLIMECSSVHCGSHAEGTGRAFFSSGGAADPVVGLHAVSLTDQRRFIRW